MDLRFGKLENNFDILEKKYQSNGNISWDTFNSNPKENLNKIIEVTQKDFDDGTLRITEPCLIRLKENILFNPNRPNTWIDNNNMITNNFAEAVKIDPERKLDWFPNFKEKPEKNKKYFEKEVRNAYRLGFFCAIAIENKDIIIDLNNFTIQQHPEHALQQRFFSVIELADQPFVPKQGPSNFGNTLISGSNILIKNGIIGLSSHHGIHGNNNNTILIKDVKFVDNEVCSIAINGGKYIYISNVNIIRNRHDIPVLGTYANGRFLKLFIDKLDDGISNPHEEYIESCEYLKKELDQVFNSTILKNGPMPDIYENKEGLIDGNYYGIIINPLGIAVNAPLKNRKNPKANDSFDIYLKSVSVNNIKTNISEVLAIKNKENKILTAPSGGLFQFMSCSEVIGDKYYYKGNSLTDVQVEIVDVVNRHPNLIGFLGKFKIDNGILEWKRNPTSYFKHHINKFIGFGSLENHNYDIIGNGDNMFHVNKGTFGIKIDGLNSSTLEDIYISNIESHGEKGSILAGHYQKSHPLQAHLNGYQGCFLIGIEINASDNVTAKNINIKSLESKYGSSYALRVSGESNKIKVIDSNVDEIKACQIPFSAADSYWPNLPTNARGLYVSDNCNLEVKNISIENIIDTPDCLIPSEVEIYSNVKFN